GVTMLFSPDSQTLAVRSNRSQKLSLRAAATGKVWAELEIDTELAVDNVFAFSPDSQALLTSTNQGIIWWDLTANKPRSKGLLLPTKDVEKIMFSNSGRVVACVQDRKAVLWEMATKKQATARELPDHYLQVQFTRTGQFLAVAMGGEGD